MQFREEASKNMRSSSVLDLPVRLTHPMTWIVVAAIGAVLAAGGIWSVFGTLPRHLDAAGVLVPRQGYFAVQSVFAGQIVSISITEGAVVEPGLAVAVVSDGERRSFVRARRSGRIVQVRAKVGQVIASGGAIGVAESVSTVANDLVAALYLPPGNAQEVTPGSQVDLAVDTAPAATHGMLRGTVDSVSAAVETPGEVADFLGDAHLAEVLSGNRVTRKVIVRLGTSDATVSGYTWTNRVGPRFKIGAGAGVIGLIAEQPKRPIDWLLR